MSGPAQKLTRASRAITIAGVVLLALIIVLPNVWFRRIDWIVLLYALCAAVASALAIVAAYSKQSEDLAERIIVLVGINAVGMLGVGFVFFTFRMSAP